MKTGKIISSAIAGTSAMTLFSYLVSKSENKNFREPEVMAQLIERFPKSCSKKLALIAAWNIHYAIGLSFVVLYNEIWKKEKIKPSFTSGVVLGAASGLVGIVGWKSAFEAHPNPPAKNLKPFLGHLLAAHMVFGIVSALTYKLIPAGKNS